MVPAEFAHIPLGKQRLHPARHPSSIFYVSNSGIWQTVWLEPVSPSPPALLAAQSSGSFMCAESASRLVECCDSALQPGDALSCDLKGQAGRLCHLLRPDNLGISLLLAPLQKKGAAVHLPSQQVSGPSD